MSETLDDAVAELVLANRILDREGVVDAFGHVSVRHPERPDRFLLAAALPPALVTTDDILEHGPDGEPVLPGGPAPYAERVIHAAIYRVRPDVRAVCHHHDPRILPFAVSGAPLVPVIQAGGVLGTGPVPLWDSREAFGDTNLLLWIPLSFARNS